MADISKITLPNNSEYDLKDATARSGLTSKQDKITANGLLQGDGSGNITAVSSTSAGTISIDSAPTENSTNLVTSGGVYTALSNVDALPAQSSSTDGKILTSVYNSSTSTASASWENAPVTSVNTQTGAVSLTYSDVSAASSTHTHGNITNGGALQTTDISIANGDKLVVTDATDSNKIARTSLSFDGSTTNKYLSPKGTWENVPSVPSPADATPLMDNATAAVGTSTDYAREDHVHPSDTSRQAKITASGILKGDGNGNISAATAGTDYQSPITTEEVTEITIDTTVTASSNNLITSGAVATAISNVDALPSQTGNSGKFLTTNGTTASWATVGDASTMLNRSTAVNVADTNYSTVMARGIYAGDTDLTAGTSTLTSGVIYLYYE